MPALFILMLIIIVRGLTLPGGLAGLEYLFAPRWEDFNASALFNAMGFCFFSLSLGAGTMITYGSYLSPKADLPGAVGWVAVLAIMSSILGGLMVLPAVFAFGLDQSAGPGLTFVTMPAVFSKMPLGQLFAVMFYVCLVVAALTSSVSMLEACTALLTRQFNMRRTPAILLTVASCTVVGLASTLSFGVWSDVKFFNRTIFDILDYVTSNVGMPLSTFGIAIAAAWVAWPTMKRELTAARPVSESGLWFIRIMIGVVSPLFVLGRRRAAASDDRGFRTPSRVRGARTGVPRTQVALDRHPVPRARRRHDFGPRRRRGLLTSKRREHRHRPRRPLSHGPPRTPAGAFSPLGRSAARRGHRLPQRSHLGTSPCVRTRRLGYHCVQYRASRPLILRTTGRTPALAPCAGASRRGIRTMSPNRIIVARFSPTAAPAAL